MQVNHGKAAPLRRMRPGDRVVYYSPTERFRGKDRLQAFTAIGVVRDSEPMQVDMGGGFEPFRRAVDWWASVEVPIRPLLQRLAFTANNPRWGYQFRFGLFEIDAADMDILTTSLRVCCATRESS